MAFDHVHIREKFEFRLCAKWVPFGEFNASCLVFLPTVHFLRVFFWFVRSDAWLRRWLDGAPFFLLLLLLAAAVL